MSISDHYTLREFAKTKLPDNWFRYCRESEGLLVKPWQETAPIANVLAQQFLFQDMREAGKRARGEYLGISRLIKELLCDCEVVADDADHKCVRLERRHFADAVLEIENNALRQGGQRWTNVEVRDVIGRQSIQLPSPTLLPSAPKGQGGARKIDDSIHLERLREMKATAPEASIRSYVRRNSGSIEGSSDGAKDRRLQRKFRATR